MVTRIRDLRFLPRRMALVDLQKSQQLGQMVLLSLMIPKQGQMTRTPRNAYRMGVLVRLLLVNMMMVRHNRAQRLLL
ncbi:MAG: hypothetical protein ACYTFW_00410 [Planctomycetota bacterium]|jgi:hypothetical protein